MRPVEITIRNISSFLINTVDKDGNSILDYNKHKTKERWVATIIYGGFRSSEESIIYNADDIEGGRKAFKDFLTLIQSKI